MAEYKMKTVQELLGGGESWVSEFSSAVSAYNSLMDAGSRRSWMEQTRELEAENYILNRMNYYKTALNENKNNPQVVAEVGKQFRDNIGQLKIGSSKPNIRAAFSVLAPQIMNAEQNVAYISQLASDITNWQVSGKLDIEYYKGMENVTDDAGDPIMESVYNTETGEIEQVNIQKPKAMRIQTTIDQLKAKKVEMYDMGILGDGFTYKLLDDEIKNLEKMRAISLDDSSVSTFSENIQTNLEVNIYKRWKADSEQSTSIGEMEKDAYTILGNAESERNSAFLALAQIDDDIIQKTATPGQTGEPEDTLGLANLQDLRRTYQERLTKAGIAVTDAGKKVTEINVALGRSQQYAGSTWDLRSDAEDGTTISKSRAVNVLKNDFGSTIDFTTMTDIEVFNELNRMSALLPGLLQSIKENFHSLGSTSFTDKGVEVFEAYGDFTKETSGKNYKQLNKLLEKTKLEIEEKKKTTPPVPQQPTTTPRPPPTTAVSQKYQQRIDRLHSTLETVMLGVNTSKGEKADLDAKIDAVEAEMEQNVSDRAKTMNTINSLPRGDLRRTLAIEHQKMYKQWEVLKHKTRKDLNLKRHKVKYDIVQQNKKANQLEREIRALSEQPDN